MASKVGSGYNYTAAARKTGSPSHPRSANSVQIVGTPHIAREAADVFD